MPGKERTRKLDLRALWRQRAVRWALVALAVPIILFVGLRYGIGYGVKLWLTSRTDMAIRIEHLDINPFTGRVVLQHLDIGHDGRTALRIPQAVAALAPLSLWQDTRRLVIERAAVEGLDLSIEESKGTWRLSGLPAALLPPPATPKAETTRWSIRVVQLAVRDSRLAYRQGDLSARVAIEQAAFAANLVTGEPGASLHLDLDARLGQLEVRRAQAQLFAAASADLERLRLRAGTNVEIAALRLRDIAVAAETGQDGFAGMRAPELRIETVRMGGEPGLAIDTVALHAPTVALHRDATGRWRGWSGIAVPGDGGGAPLALRMKQFTIRDGAKVQVNDALVVPDFRETLLVDSAEINDLDSGDTAAWTSFALRARLGRYGRVQLEGRMQPLAERLMADLRSKVERLDLPPFSPYSARELGYLFTSGQLDATVKLAARAGKLDGTIKVTLKNLKVAPKPGPRLEQLQTQLKMPLETALNSLRDRQNDIRLSLPLTGDASEPRFDLGDTINQALGKAMRSATLSYLKYYFQPYGTLITLVELAGKAAELRLDPVVFAPGTATLDDTARSYLERVAGLAGERPDLRLQVCGIAVPGDGAAGARDLPALARQRAEAVKAHLVQGHGLDPARLFVCHPETSDKADAQARVELKI